MTTSLQQNSRHNFLALFTAVASGQGKIKKKRKICFWFEFCFFSCGILLCFVFLNTATHFLTFYVFCCFVLFFLLQLSLLQLSLFSNSLFSNSLFSNSLSSPTLFSTTLSLLQLSLLKTKKGNRAATLMIERSKGELV